MEVKITWNITGKNENIFVLDTTEYSKRGKNWNKMSEADKEMIIYNEISKDFNKKVGFKFVSCE